jgi:hypothetical protein
MLLDTAVYLQMFTEDTVAAAKLKSNFLSCHLYYVMLTNQAAQHALVLHCFHSTVLQDDLIKFTNGLE